MSLFRPTSFTSASGITYQQQFVSAGRNSPPRCKIIIDTELPYTVRVDVRDKFRNWVESMGLANDFKTGDPGFDGAVYIDSDDPQFCQALGTNSTLRRAITELFSYIKTLTITRKRISGLFQRPDRSPPSKSIEKVVQLLAEVNKQLQGTVMPGQQPYRSGRRLLSQVISGCLLGSFIIAFVLQIALLDPPRQIAQSTDLLMASLVLTLLICVGLVLLVRLVFSGSPYGYDIMRSMLIGILGIGFLSYGVLSYIDMHCDHSAPRLEVAQVVGEYVSHGRHSTSYYVTLHHWREAGKTYDLKVNGRIYSNVVAGRDDVALYIHPGYLGYEWIENYRVIKR